VKNECPKCRAVNEIRPINRNLKSILEGKSFDCKKCNKLILGYDEFIKH
jgi:phage FluMu protein Com